MLIEKKATKAMFLRLGYLCETDTTFEPTIFITTFNDFKLHR